MFKKFFSNNLDVFKKFSVSFIFLFAINALLVRLGYVLSGVSYNSDSILVSHLWLSLALLAGTFVSVLITLLFSYKEQKGECKLPNSAKPIINLLVSLLVSFITYLLITGPFKLFKLTLLNSFYIYYFVALGLIALGIIFLPMFFSKKFDNAKYLIYVALNLLGIGILWGIVSALTGIIIAFSLDVLNLDFIEDYIPAIFAFVGIVMVVPQVFKLFDFDLSKEVALKGTLRAVVRVLHMVLQFFWIVYSILLYIYTIEFFLNLDSKSIAGYTVAYLLLSFALLVLYDYKIKKSPEKDPFVWAVIISGIVQAIVMIFAVVIRIMVYALTIARGYALLFPVLYIMLMLWIVYSLKEYKRIEYSVLYRIILVVLVIFTYVPFINIIDLSIASLQKKYDKADMEVVYTVIKYKGVEAVKNELGEDVYNKYKLYKAKDYERFIDVFNGMYDYETTNQKIHKDLEGKNWRCYLGFFPYYAKGANGYKLGSVKGSVFVVAHIAYLHNPVYDDAKHGLADVFGHSVYVKISDDGKSLVLLVDNKALKTITLKDIAKSFGSKVKLNTECADTSYQVDPLVYHISTADGEVVLVIHSLHVDIYSKDKPKTIIQALNDSSVILKLRDMQVSVYYIKQ